MPMLNHAEAIAATTDTGRVQLGGGWRAVPTLQMGSPKSASPPPVPIPPPLPPQLPAAVTAATAASQSAQQSAARGLAGTILTSPQGTTGAAAGGGKTLTGQ